LNIYPANENQFEMVRKFYHSLTDAMKDSQFKIGWVKDVYPAPDYLRTSIHNGRLYIGLTDHKIAAAMIVDHHYNDSYKKFQWQTTADDSEVLLIHALGVHPDYARRGFAKKMVRKVFEIGKETNMKAIRLDVLGGNIPAEKLYESLGFQYMHTLQMFYEDTGWTDFRLYEYVL